ncbi:MAG: DUF4479 domain-containing protein [Bacilli bacterium]|jgi:tRNA-binding protein|nr:DUF4479 domain-containing protein [Bacilli bacterium]
MRYGLFYNYHGVGDVLLIKVNDETPNKVITNGNVVGLFYDDKLVGYNIFKVKNIIKIKVKGMIVNPSAEMIKVINNILINAGFAALPLQNSRGFYVGEVLEAIPHPDSDHLTVAKVDIGKERPLQIVCGAKNCRSGIKVVTAINNTMMFDGTLIKEGELRGVKSEGMLCSSSELNFPHELQQEGIYILEDDAIVGEDVFKEKENNNE